MDRQDVQKMGMRLLKKGHIGMVRLVFSRIGLLALLLVLQVALVLTAFILCGQYMPHLIVIQGIFVVVMVLYLINSNFDPSAKITWLVFIMIVPVFGTLFLLYTRMDVGHRALRDRLRLLVDETKDALPQDERVLKELEQTSPESAALDRYLNQTGCFPVYDRTEVSYFPLGEDKFEEMLIQLEKAEHFIFLEYFIIEEGEMWGRILEILVRKASQGVEVRLMYDGTNEFATLPYSYPRKLKELGIKCKAFAPIAPFVSTHYNYRDHRKILVIDGHTAFTGGVNLSDRYINREQVFGHWKDTAVMLKGPAARSFTLLFLQMWNIDEKEPEFAKYLNYPAEPVTEAQGYVIPYGDSPLDGYRVGEMVYIDILNRAKNYVHIMTPYLILDGELDTALRFAAERGVEVSIILPGIPDKRTPYALAKTHYASLIRAGVKIYEYTPGFVHAKVFSSDDKKAVVGTINLDYRSLYHHFECAAYMVDTPCISDIEADFADTLAKCHRVTLEDVKNLKTGMKLRGILSKAISTLL
ncbi:MAG: cardiolipin synthase [Candidatus Limivicinus sp.]|nr:cardiolipin synthase [Clostridiales bacterium]MDY6133311.1 cardiolipin synthase [Candidatus Limivicinus sp.]